MENSTPSFSTVPAFTRGPPPPGAVAPRIPETSGWTNRSSVFLLK